MVFVWQSKEFECESFLLSLDNEFNPDSSVIFLWNSNNLGDLRIKKFQ